MNEPQAATSPAATELRLRVSARRSIMVPSGVSESGVKVEGELPRSLANGHQSAGPLLVQKGTVKGFLGAQLNRFPVHFRQTVGFQGEAKQPGSCPTLVEKHVVTEFRLIGK